MYLMHWKSKVTGLAGHGSKPLSFKCANSWIESLNIKYPEIHHWLEEVFDRTWSDIAREEMIKYVISFNQSYFDITPFISKRFLNFING